MPLVHLENVSRRYGRVQALAGVNLTLEPGVIGLVGNNGAGKSTLLKILLGLLVPDGGAGTILGCTLDQADRQLRGRVGYMAETSAAPPLLRGADFVALSGELYGMPPRDARRRGHEMLDDLGLGQLRYRRLEEYSLGNLQRLKLAAALVHDPELLLLDEPTGGLDPRGRRDMIELIEDLAKQTGKSVILCTHLLPDVERLCDQVVILHQGRVIRHGKLEQLGRPIEERYELGCSGQVIDYWAALRQQGVRIEEMETPGRAHATSPADWPTSRFFAVAREQAVTIDHLRPEREDLERLFFRLTEAAPAATAEAGR